ncbi:hypothetical protein ACSFBX_22395 [Variovorax sp. RB2P76]|uniref:hypothetical protein n=1 Tax=Variovorax sp. RB2P76 TaxID=3443736 RepID=UPI003F44A8D0
MTLLSRFKKEQALKAAGVLVPPYPGTAGSGAASAEADIAFVDAGTAWEQEIDRLYIQLLSQRSQEPSQESVDSFVAVCESRGLAEALGQLNRRVPHRFTAVYRLEGDLFRNIALIDKAGEARPEYLEEVPMGISFCQFVLRDGAFLTTNSAHDDRLDGHPYKGVMVAYHGVPIPGAGGTLLGTLCHFDLLERPLSDAEFEHLRSVGLALPPYLPQYLPPYLQP